MTTVTATMTRTECAACASAEPTAGAVPEGWTTTAVECTQCGPKTATVTLTKPVTTPTETLPSAVIPTASQAEHQMAGEQQKTGSQAGMTEGSPSGPKAIASQTKAVEVKATTVPSQANAEEKAYPGSEQTSAVIEGAGETGTRTIEAYSTVVPVRASGVAGSSTGPGLASGTAVRSPSAAVPIFEGAASGSSVGMSAVGAVAMLVAGVLVL